MLPLFRAVKKTFVNSWLEKDRFRKLHCLLEGVQCFRNGKR